MSIIALLLTLVIYGLVFWILWWGLGKVGLPEPFNKVAVVVLVIASIVVLIGILTGQIAPFPFLLNSKL
jgi:heme A synthase